MQTAQGGAKIGEKPALVVREMAKQGLEKLGYFSVGRKFDIPMGDLQGPRENLPDAPPLAQV